jgi:hypothetical protein
MISQVVSIVGLCGVFALYYNYLYHSEAGFARAMGILNCVMFFAVGIYFKAFERNTIMSGLKYGWTILYTSTISFCLLWLMVSLYDSQWYVTYSIWFKANNLRLIFVYSAIGLTITIWAFEQERSHCIRVPYM